MAEPKRSDDEQAALAREYAAHIERVQQDLNAVIRRHAQTLPWKMVTHALVESTGIWLALLATEQPSALPMLLTRLDELRLYLATSNQRAQ
jgi:hypothetical protein